MIKKFIKKILLRLKLFKPYQEKQNVVAAPVTEDVARYYDKETDAYLGSYGNIFQASRPTSDDELIAYYSKQLGLKSGMRVLDAGCGIGGPAVALAKLNNVFIEGITISPVQVIKGNQFVADNGLSDRVNISLNDFATLEKKFPADSFDLVYYMESIGYANNLRDVLNSARSVLKSGGCIYIKDFFLTAITNPEHKKVQIEYAAIVRSEYHYKALVIHELMKVAYELGFYIEYIVPFGLHQDFSSASAFEETNNHHSIYNLCIRLPFQIYEALEVKFRKL